MNALYLVRHSGEELKNAQVLASISNGLEVSGKGPQGFGNEALGSIKGKVVSPIHKEWSPRRWEGSTSGPKVFPMAKRCSKGSLKYCKMFPASHKVFPGHGYGHGHGHGHDNGQHHGPGHVFLIILVCHMYIVHHLIRMCHDHGQWSTS